MAELKVRDRVIWTYHPPGGGEPLELPARVLAVRRDQVQIRVLIAFEHGPAHLRGAVAAGYHRYVPKTSVLGGDRAVAFHVECMIAGKMPQGRV